MAVSVDEAVSAGPARDHTPPARRLRGRGRSALEVTLLTVLAVVMLFPVLWMIETSIKENRDVYAIPA
ncbi:carbohydrate ABC transporter permease, partial [Micromonospora vinacea]